MSDKSKAGFVLDASVAVNPSIPTASRNRRSPSVCVDRARGTRYGQCRKGAQLYCLCGEGTHIHTPALLCSVIGNDASSRAADLAAELNKQISSIAIGSAEGFNQVERAINKACKTRRWMLPRTSTWPRDGSSNSRENCTRYSPSVFRLFLRIEINPKVPSGIRANSLRTFSTIPAARMMKLRPRPAVLLAFVVPCHLAGTSSLRPAGLG